MMGALFRWGGRLLEEIQLYRYHLRIKSLVTKGLTIGKNVIIEYKSYIDDNYPYLIYIGDNCSISNHVRLLAHDATTFRCTDGHTRLGKVELKENCFIGERAIILPGVEVGPHAMVGAGAVVTHDVPPYGLVMGVPARLVGCACRCGVTLGSRIGVNGNTRVTCEKCGETYLLNRQKGRIVVTGRVAG